MSGFHTGIVVNNRDPRQKNRLRLRVPSLLGPAETGWIDSLIDLTLPPAVGELVRVTQEGEGDTLLYLPENIGAQGDHDHPHGHDASETTSGTFADARIPSLDASKIISGVFPLSRIPTPVSFSVLDTRSHPSNTTSSATYHPSPTASPDRQVSAIFSQGLPGGSWRGALTVKGWEGAYAAWQLIGPAGSGAADDNFYLRSGLGSGDWRQAVKIWHDANFDPATKSDATHDHGGILDPATWETGALLTTDATIELDGTSTPFFKKVVGADARNTIGAAAASHGNHVYRDANGTLATKLPNEYPDGITYQRVGAADGYPEGYGTVVTVCSDSARAGQTFYSSTGTVWSRSHLTSTSWGKWAPISSTAFTATGMAFGTGWSNYGASWATLSAQEMPGGVYVRGLIKGDGSSTTIARLAPEHRRQDVFHMLSLMGNGPAGIKAYRVDVNTSGQFIAYESGVYAWLSMETFVPFDF